MLARIAALPAQPRRHRPVLRLDVDLAGAPLRFDLWLLRLSGVLLFLR
jgi:hypothetical protein